MKINLKKLKISNEIFRWFGDNFESGELGLSSAALSCCEGLTDNPVSVFFTDKGEACNFMLMSWKYMYKHSIASMDGLFNSQELGWIIEIHNGHILEPQYFGHGLLWESILESAELDGLNTKWGIETSELLKKVISLDPLQSLCLELWAYGYWHQGQSFCEKYLDKYFAHSAM